MFVQKIWDSVAKGFRDRTIFYMQLLVLSSRTKFYKIGKTRFLRAPDFCIFVEQAKETVY